MLRRLTRVIASRSVTDARVAADTTFENALRLASRCYSELKEATRVHDQGVEEYYRLQRSRMKLLLRTAELVVRYEKIGLSRAARELEEMLEDEGVERYEPQIGGPVDRGKCSPIPMERQDMPPGRVALVSTPGFVGSDGEVVLRARVFESVPPPVPLTAVPRIYSPTREGTPVSRELLDLLLLLGADIRAA